MRLRNYEKKADRRLRKLLPQKKSVVAVSPTGSGKTVLVAALLKAAFQKKKVLWVAHRRELLRQARTKLLEAGILNSEIGILSGLDHENVSARILVVSVDILRHRPIPKVDLIVIDEAHRVTAEGYQRILRRNPKALVLGLTATPWRLDGQGLGDTFKYLYLVSTQAELIGDKFLARPVTYGVDREKVAQLTKGLRLSRTTGDYSTKALEKRLLKPVLMGNIVKECGRIAPEESTIVFATTRKHGKALRRRFLKVGRKTAYLDWKTPSKEREKLLHDFQTGHINIIVNVDVLSEGVDLPRAKCIVLARPTRSLTRYLQMVGRGSRPFEDRKVIIVDHAGNAYRHGLPQIDREWDLNGQKSGRQGASVLKCCHECKALIPAGSEECEICGAKQHRTRRDIREREAFLEKLRATRKERELLTKSLRDVAKDRGLSETWVQRSLRELAGSDK